MAAALPARVLSAVRGCFPTQSDDYAAVEGSEDSASVEAAQKPPEATPPSRAAWMTIVVLAVIGTAAMSTAILSVDAVRFRLYGSDPPSTPRPTFTNKVVFRTWGDNGAGIGSVTEQLAGSIVFAEAFGAEHFAIESVGTEHGFDTVGAIEKMRDTRIEGVDYSRICALSRYFNRDTYRAFTYAACEATRKGVPMSPRDVFTAKKMSGCTVFINDEPWDYRPELCVCTWRHTTRQFGYPLPRSVPEKVAVGLHIRWGDMAGKGQWNDALTPYRSIPIDTANAVLHGLEECLGPLDVRLYMEQHNSSMLARISHPFRLVDTRDDTGDLVDLAKNEVLVVAGSSYTQLAHQMSRGGLTLVPDEDAHMRWWDVTGTHEVLKWGALSKPARDCDEVRRLYAKGLQRSKVEVARVAARGDGVEGTILVAPPPARTRVRW